MRSSSNHYEICGEEGPTLRYLCEAKDPLALARGNMKSDQSKSFLSLDLYDCGPFRGLGGTRCARKARRPTGHPGPTEGVGAALRAPFRWRQRVRRTN